MDSLDHRPATLPGLYLCGGGQTLRGLAEPELYGAFDASQSGLLAHWRAVATTLGPLVHGGLRFFVRSFDRPRPPMAAHTETGPLGGSVLPPFQQCGLPDRDLPLPFPGLPGLLF